MTPSEDCVLSSIGIPFDSAAVDLRARSTTALFRWLVPREAGARSCTRASGGGRVPVRVIAMVARAWVVGPAQGDAARRRALPRTPLRQPGPPRQLGGAWPSSDLVACVRSRVI